MVTRWRFDNGGSHDYLFIRNPDRYGGDSGWVQAARMSLQQVIGSSVPNIQHDGFSLGQRNIKFTAITGTMMRTLRNFYLRGETISNCTDHLYPTTTTFSCFITSFTSGLHPTSTTGFPGSGEDTYDVEMTLLRMA